MRVFENKWFHRWARGEGISDCTLFDAALEVAKGQVEANLGGWLFKKRPPRGNTGKSSGYRTIVGYKGRDAARVIFLYGFAKSAKGNISDKEEAALSLASQAFLSATDGQVEKLVAEGSIWEIQQHE